MATTGAFTFNLNNIRDVTNNSTGVVEQITEALSDYGDLMGLGIAIAVAVGLIFGAILVIIGFIPVLIKKVKGYRGS